MPYKDKDEAQKYNREWKKRTYQEKREARLVVQRRSAAKLKADPERYALAKAKNRERMKKLMFRYKMKVLEHYSKGEPICACCGEKETKFLTVDHINNGGNAHRAETGAGSSLHRWLINHNFPEGFQILCFNCNCGRSVNGGICPHKEENHGKSIS